jgi:signal transduction histidine kinase
MPSPSLSEKDKSEILSKNELLYTPKDDVNKAIVLFASQICNTSIAFISIVNQNNEWFKASIGLTDQEEEDAKPLSFYVESDNTSNIIEIQDLTLSTKFNDNPFFIKNDITFFAAIPLITKNGRHIGSISVMDKKKKKLTPKQKKALTILSIQLMNASENRLTKDQVEKNILVFEKKNAVIEEFTNIAMENMTSPLNTITLLSEIINKNCSEELNSQLTGYLKLIENSSNKMISLIEEVKDFYKNVDLITLEKEEFFLDDLFKTINNKNINVTFSNRFDRNIKIRANKLALIKIFKKYIESYKGIFENDEYEILVSFQEKEDNYLFILRNNDIDFSRKYIKRDSIEEYRNQLNTLTSALVTALGGDKSIDYTNQGKVVRFYILK